MQFCFAIIQIVVALDDHLHGATQPVRLQYGHGSCEEPCRRAIWQVLRRATGGRGPGEDFAHADGHNPYK